jgi:glycosyltransferase involved in cell wall biosynthesis
MAVKTNSRTVKLTVGIPTFNRARWLRESMESVLAQTFADFRLIVSDNASEDDTPDVVRSFDDDRIRYLRSSRNVGPIGNLNRLIASTETDFLVLLPDDDVLFPGHLAAAVDVLERFENVGLVHSAFRFIDAQSRVVRDVTPLPTRPQVRIDRRERALEYLTVSDWGLCFPSVAYRTKAIRGAGGLREEEGPFGDRQLWMRIALGWDFGYVAEPLVGFRTHPESITRNIGAQGGVTPDGRELYRAHSRTIFQQRMDFLDDAPVEPRRRKRLRALAELQLLVKSASGLPWRETAARLAGIVQTYPRIVLRRELWHLVAAQLGGRRVHSALRRPTEARPARVR